MIIRKTERYYKERKKTWLKHSSFDKELHTEFVKRVTIWFIIIPIFWYEKVTGHSL